MATSGSYDSNSTRNQIIDTALRKIGVLAEGETSSSQQVADAASDMERMIKAWQGQGIHIWKETEAVLFLATSQSIYSLGATTTDHYVLYDDLTTTTLSAAAADTATSLTVSSISGISDGDYIGIVMDDTTIHWSTVNGTPSGSTVNIDDAIDDDAASGNAVYAYTSKAVRPLQVRSARVQLDSTSETIVTEVGGEGYFDLANKAASGVPISYYYKPALSNGKLYLYPTTSDERYYLNLTTYIPIEDFDTSSNNPDFPVEWHEAIVWNLGKRLLPEYGINDPVTVQMVIGMAAESLQIASDFDVEEGDIIIMPDYV